MLYLFIKFQVCPGGLCKSYKDCVECKAYGTSALSIEDCFKCSIEPILVDYIPDSLGEYFSLCISIKHFRSNLFCIIKQY